MGYSTIHQKQIIYELKRAYCTPLQIYSLMANEKFQKHREFHNRITEHSQMISVPLPKFLSSW